MIISSLLMISDSSLRVLFMNGLKKLKIFEINYVLPKVRCDDLLSHKVPVSTVSKSVRTTCSVQYARVSNYGNCPRAAITAVLLVLETLWLINLNFFLLTCCSPLESAQFRMFQSQPLSHFQSFYYRSLQLMNGVEMKCRRSEE